jgi:hypothetical protein
MFQFDFKAAAKCLKINHLPVQLQTGTNVFRLISADRSFLSHPNLSCVEHDAPPNGPHFGCEAI